MSSFVLFGWFPAPTNNNQTTIKQQSDNIFNNNKQHKRQQTTQQQHNKQTTKKESSIFPTIPSTNPDTTTALPPPPYPSVFSGIHARKRISCANHTSHPRRCCPTLSPSTTLLGTPRRTVERWSPVPNKQPQKKQKTKINRQCPTRACSPPPPP